MREEVVEEVRPHRLVVAHVLEDRGGLGVDVGDLRDEVVVEHVLPHAGAGAGDQQLRVGIADQRLGAFGLSGAGGGDHDRGGSDAGGDVPGVVVRAQ